MSRTTGEHHPRHFLGTHLKHFILPNIEIKIVENLMSYFVVFHATPSTNANLIYFQSTTASVCLQIKCFVARQSWTTASKLTRKKVCGKVQSSGFVENGISPIHFMSIV